MERFTQPGGRRMPTKKAYGYGSTQDTENILIFRETTMHLIQTKLNNRGLCSSSASYPIGQSMSIMTIFQFPGANRIQAYPSRCFGASFQVPSLPWCRIARTSMASWEHVQCRQGTNFTPFLGGTTGPRCPGMERRIYKALGILGSLK